MVKSITYIPNIVVRRIYIMGLEESKTLNKFLDFILALNQIDCEESKNLGPELLGSILFLIKTVNA